MAIFGPILAITQTGDIARSAAGKVYAVGDTLFATPLDMTDLSGVTITDALSDTGGVIQPFQVSGHNEVVWKSGEWKVPIRAFGSVLDEAAASAASASSAATAAAAAQAAAEEAQEAVENLLENGSGAGTFNHSALSNLDKDDHPQYFNQTRGDARYYTQGQVDTKINQAAQANSAGDRDRGNHTGTQALSSVNGLVAALSARLRVVLVSTGTESRPSDSAVVLWVGGTTEPVNMGAVDLWLADAEVDPGDDNSAPSVPTGLAASSLTATTATVTWNASSDNVGVTGYEVFLDGNSAGTPTTTSLDLEDLTPDTEYSVTVRARDAAGNWSAQSSAVGFTTPPEVLTGYHSVFASTSHPTLDVISDATPIVATAFYTFSSSANGWRCRGGRVYIPGSVTPPDSLAVSAWTGTDPELGDTPVRTAIIESPNVGWNEVLWSSPLDMTPSSPVWIGYQFDDGRYLSAAAPAGALQSVVTDFLYRADSTDFGGRSRRKVGITATAPSQDVWGCDILVDEGA
jgi:hypothetical protein